MFDNYKRYILMNSRVIWCLSNDIFIRIDNNILKKYSRNKYTLESGWKPFSFKNAMIPYNSFFLPLDGGKK